MGHHALPATSTPAPSFAPTGGSGDGACTQLGHGSTGAGWQRAAHTHQRRTPDVLATAGAAGGVDEDGATTPHALLVRYAQGPRMQVVPGVEKGAALLLPAPRGAPSAGARQGACAIAHALWDGRRLRPCPPPPPKGGGKEEMASQRWGAAPAHRGRSGSPSRGHGRAKGAETSP